MTIQLRSTGSSRVGSSTTAGVVDAGPGLYVLGVPFLHGFTSMLVFGAGADAAYVVEHIRGAAGRPLRAAA